MTNFFSQLKKEAERIHLSPKERESMRHALERHMQENPLTKSPFVVTPSLYFSILNRYSTVALLIVLVTAGTTYAAERTVPGDFLYPVKITVNESAQSALAFSSEAKASLHARFAERRMVEAETLASRGTLTPEAKVELENNFNQHAEELQASVAEVEKENPAAAADISTKFESALAAHSALIAELGNTNGSGENREESDTLSRFIKGRERKIVLAKAGVRVKAERTPAGEVSVQTFASGTSSAISASIVVSDAGEAVAEQLGESASSTLDEAEGRFSGLKAQLDASTTARISLKFKELQGKIGKLQGEKNHNPQAKEKLEKALKDATVLNAFLEAQEKFDGKALLPALPVTTNGEGEQD